MAVTSPAPRHRRESDAPTVYLVLPAYNEEASLPALLPRAKTALEEAGIPYHVILVNDGSADRTPEVAIQHAARMPLTLVDHERNKGLGEALKSGLLRAGALAASHDVIVTMDADNTHPPDLIPAMLGRIRDGFDLVIASRFVDGGQQVGLRLHRRVLSRTAGLLLRTLFPVPGVTDYTCGFRAYRASVVKAALDAYGPSLVQERGFSCFVEVLLKLRTLRARACQVPLVLRYDFKEGASKMRVMRTIVRYGRLIATNLVLPGTKPFRTLAPGSALAAGPER
jgi:dolichol-phosphate mannosyltransferase